VSALPSLLWGKGFIFREFDLRLRSSPSGSLSGCLCRSAPVVDLEGVGIEHLGFDRFIDGAQEVGEFAGSGVDCAALEFDSVTACEALALAVMRKMVAKFITHDLADELWPTEGARDAGDRGGAGERLFLLVGFENELRDAGDTPVNFATGRFEFAVLAFFDDAVGLGVGFNFVRNEFCNNDAFDPAGEELIFGAESALSLFSFYGDFLKSGLEFLDPFNEGLVIK